MSLYCKDTSCLTASLSHIKIQTFFWLLFSDLSLMKVVDNESLKVKRNKCPKCRDTEKMKVKGERKNM